MKDFPRLCAYCHAPLAGRADKRYCSSSCKSKDFRRPLAGDAFESDEGDEPADDAPRWAPSGPAVKVALREAPRPPRPRVQEPDDDVDTDDDFEADDVLEADDEADAPFAGGRALDRQARQLLPQQFGRCLAQVLAAHGRLLRGRQLRGLREDVADAIRAYAGLVARGPLPPDMVAQLTTLHRVRLVVDEWLEEYKAHYRPVAVHVNKKRRTKWQAACTLLGLS